MSYIEDVFDLLNINPKAPMVYDYETHCEYLSYLYERFDDHFKITFLYYPDENIFIDSQFGYPVLDLYRYVNPWQVESFKRWKACCEFPNFELETLIELVYDPENIED